MPYLNLDLDYFTHPKTLRLIGLLGKGSEVLPVKLWCHTGKHHAEDGKLSGYSEKEIEAVVGWWGADSACVDAMVRVGFIIKDEEGYRLHEWLDHEGHLVMFKKRAKQAAQARWGSDPNSNATSNAQGEAKQCPIPNQTIPYQKEKAKKFDFDLLWNKFPKRIGRKQAERSFISSVVSADDWHLINRALINYVKSERVSKGFVQNGSTWFNNWRDWITYTEEKKNGFNGKTGLNSHLDRLLDKEVRGADEKPDLVKVPDMFT